MAQTVFVGMSGGVDSSVSAALLKEQGYKVVGVYMKNWTRDMPGFPCPWKRDYNDAKRVAVQLGIDFKVYDFEKEYKQKVVDYMIAEYQAGRTPNPDIMCNQEVKFRLFLESAISDGADMIATGHYARVIRNEGKTSKQLKRNVCLGVASNKEKDQTYFLYRVSEEALHRTLFPLGDISSKRTVRNLAKKLGLVTADKKDSQGICFVGKVGIKEFLGQYVEASSGDIVDRKGNILGKHEGAIFYTIGQRHGLNIGGGLPYYVVDKNMKTNQVIVSNDLDDDLLWDNELRINQCHWINNKPKINTVYQFRTRYRAALVNGKITHISGSNCRIELEDQLRAITSGQSAVIYDGDTVLGGGIVQ